MATKRLTITLEDGPLNRIRGSTRETGAGKTLAVAGWQGPADAGLGRGSYAAVFAANQVPV